MKQGSGGWSVEERWTSLGLKPYSTTSSSIKGHAFGFDGSILAAINLDDGRRVWKGGRCGSVQLVLLPEQDVLLVLSEEGELALVSATPDGFKEIAKVPGSRARPGTIPCWCATCCWSETARRWPRSGCRSRGGDALSVRSVLQIRRRLADRRSMFARALPLEPRSSSAPRDVKVVFRPWGTSVTPVSSAAFRFPAS